MRPRTLAALSGLATGLAIITLLLVYTPQKTPISSEIQKQENGLKKTLSHWTPSPRTLPPGLTPSSTRSNRSREITPPLLEILSEIDPHLRQEALKTYAEGLAQSAQKGLGPFCPK